ncbi:MAG: heavy metal-binding domain-containing protein, partial [Paracoccaceae bacterium]|nr:heavy metal-binding domain-containing protein [Paracoccaceae bacterium]
RQEAYDLMVRHAQDIGADAIVAMRYDANEIMDGITEVLAYGTAVKMRAV